MFKQRKHKTFNYQPRFSKENQTDSSSDNEHDTKKFISKWQASKTHRTKAKGVMPIKTLLLALVLLLICMYLLEKKYM